jgi:hypothetical protein
VVANPPGDGGVIVADAQPGLAGPLIHPGRKTGIRKAGLLDQGVKQDVRLTLSGTPRDPVHQHRVRTVPSQPPRLPAIHTLCESGATTATRHTLPPQHQLPVP